MFRIGCWADVSRIEELMKAGFDYIELNLAQVTLMSESEFEGCRRRVEQSGLKAEAFNCMLAGKDLIVGPNRNLACMEQRLAQAFRRARLLGGKILVLGSGAARRIPAGYAVEQGREEFTAFLQLVNLLAGEYGVKIAVEPLNRRETNLITSVSEAYGLVQKACLTHVHLLADLYHMALEQENFSVLETVGGALVHTHIANPDGRYYPSRKDRYDYRPFFRALQKNGYRGRVSLEGICREPENWLAETAESLLCLKEIIKEG